jgi:hypothetical protein
VACDVLSSVPNTDPWCSTTSRDEEGEGVTWEPLRKVLLARGKLEGMNPVHIIVEVGISMGTLHMPRSLGIAFACVGRGAEAIRRWGGCADPTQCYAC